jgi:hypothetical protein
VRLVSLTGPCLDLLAENQLIAAGLFERAILEHGARAAYYLEALTGAYKSRSWDKMRELIPKVLFGTCLTNPEDTIFEELAEITAQRPTKPSKFIASLEAFAGTSETTGKSFFVGLHSVLCDLTHASTAGVGAPSSQCGMDRHLGFYPRDLLLFQHPWTC